MKSPRKTVGRPKIPDSEKHRKVGVSLSKEAEVEAKLIAKRIGLSFSAFVEMAIRQELERSGDGEAQKDSSNVIHLRYLGAVAAGLPTGPVDETDDTHPVPDHYDPATHYVLRVHGESMEPDYLDGSMIVCRKLQSGEFATKGQDVICSDASGAYFKRLIYTKEGERGDVPRKAKPRLVSINPDYDEVIPIADCPIVAVVVGKA